MQYLRQETENIRHGSNCGTKQKPVNIFGTCADGEGCLDGWVAVKMEWKNV